MKWTRLKEHLLPTCMQEIDMMEDKFVKLINEIKQSKTPEILQDFFALRLDISKRIEEIDNFFDDNLGNPKILPFAKGTIQLKKLLFYNPDINNELDQPDLPQFRGLTIDLNRVQIYKASEPSAAKAKPLTNKPKVQGRVNNNPNNNQNGQSALKKNLQSPGDDYKTCKSFRQSVNNTPISKGDQTYESQSSKKNNTNVAMKKIKVRLTDEEYRLFMRFKAKKNNNNK